MKQISAWASRNVISSIFLIVVLNVFFILLAFYTGASTYQLGFILPTYVLFICGVLIACINIFYFHKRHSYRTRKILEFSFLIICFIGISVLGNQIDNTSYNPVHAAVPVAGLHKTKKPSAEEILVSLKYRDKSSLTRIEKRVLKSLRYR